MSLIQSTPPPADHSAGPVLQLSCPCGKRVPLSGNEFLCLCGRRLGELKDGVAALKQRTPYWGEIPEPTMQQLLELSSRIGYRPAVEQLFPGDAGEMQSNIMGPGRAAFLDVLPLPDNSLIMDLGAGLGAVATSMAKRHRVVALEGVWERCRFMAIRKQQDNLHNLTIVNSDFNDSLLAEGQFDCITLIGVLEWVALFDLNGPPEEVQRRFLEKLRKQLSPRGRILIGIENRFGWSQLTGCTDHSGLPYTSLMPRWMASLVSSRSPKFRSNSNNAGYRTYTYSYYGFRRLFRNAGLDIDSHWIAPSSYHHPVSMVPLTKSAIDTYVQMNWLRPPLNWKESAKTFLKKQSSHVFLWRFFGSDYMFLLKASS